VFVLLVEIWTRGFEISKGCDWLFFFCNDVWLKRLLAAREPVLLLYMCVQDNGVCLVSRVIAKVSVDSKDEPK
jgi:hypothetical protein